MGLVLWVQGSGCWERFFQTLGFVLHCVSRTFVGVRGLPLNLRSINPDIAPVSISFPFDSPL